MSTFSKSGKTIRYRDQHIVGDLNHCWEPKCQDNGKDLVDFVARWENVSDAQKEGFPADAVLFSCVDHLGEGFKQAKRLFSSTQKTGSAVYRTKADMGR